MASTIVELPFAGPGLPGRGLEQADADGSVGRYLRLGDHSRIVDRARVELSVADQPEIERGLRMRCWFAACKGGSGPWAGMRRSNQREAEGKSDQPVFHRTLFSPVLGNLTDG